MNGLGFRDWPDRLVLPSYTNIPFWLEVKKPGEEATPSQAKLHEWLRSLAYHIGVVHGLEEAKEVFHNHRAQYEVKGSKHKIGFDWPNGAMRPVSGHQRPLVTRKPIRRSVPRSRTR